MGLLTRLIVGRENSSAQSDKHTELIIPCDKNNVLQRFTQCHLRELTQLVSLLLVSEGCCFEVFRFLVALLVVCSLLASL